MTESKLIIVDLYGVIALGSYQDTCKYLAKKYNKNWQELYKIVYHKYFERAVAGEISEDDSFRLAVKELRLPEDWKKLYEKHLNFVNKINQPAINFFQDLQNKGFKIILLSKSTPPQFKETIKRLELKKYFKDVINTYDLKLPKASKQTILYLSKKLKIDPEEMILIDDQKFNLLNAKKMGVTTILYKNLEQMKKEMEVKTAFYS